MSDTLALAVLTTGRQDWGLLRPLCSAIQREEGFSLAVLVGGMACSEAFGNISAEIERQGFPTTSVMPWDVNTADVLEQTSSALLSVGARLSQLRPDALVLLGDRYETAAAALAATLKSIPIVHLYGGEETEGAFDNSLRHAITKLSHLHLVAHQAYAERILRMGEAPYSVHVVGSLGVDNVFGLQLPEREQLERLLGVELIQPIGLVTLHPTTLPVPGESRELQALLSVIRSSEATWILTLPNADPGNREIREAFLDLAAEKSRVTCFTALGEEAYLGVMKLAGFVLGNSSSGITEAPSLGVPTVNVGDRQKGRVRAPSVVDVPSDPGSVKRAIEMVLSPEWREANAKPHGTFGTGDATRQILGVLRQWTPPKPPRKMWYEGLA